MAIVLALALNATVAAAAVEVASNPEKQVAGRAVVSTNLLEGQLQSRLTGREVVYTFDGGDARIDLMEKGQPYALHMRDNGRVAWALDRAGNATPLPMSGLVMVFDAENPCTALGMMAVCDRLADKVLAGRTCRHWRYRNAARHGPFASSEGDVWLDAETGLIMSYASEHNGTMRRWDVRAIHFERPDRSVFLPKHPASPRSIKK